MRFKPETKKYLRTLIVLALPLIIQDLINSLVNIVDSFMVGSLGLSAINGVGFANQIFFLQNIMVFGICSGSGIFMSQYWGKRDTESICKVLGICAITSLIGSSAFALFSWFAPQVLIGIFTQNPDALAMGVEYLRIVSVTYILSAITISISFSLRSVGMTRIPMITTGTSLIINACLNYLFIMILKMGVSGAAIATVIARTVELTLQIILVKKLKLPILAPFRQYFTANRAFLKTFFKTTTPVIINEFIWALGISIYAVAYQFAGNEAQGAVQITQTLSQLFFVFGFGTGATSGIMIANQLGANEIETAVDYAKRSMIMSIVLSVVTSGLLILFAPLLLSIYKVGDNVKLLAEICIIVTAVGSIVKNFNFVTIVGILRSGGDTRFCLFLDVASVWCIGIPIAFLGAAVFHLPIYWVIALVHIEEIFKVILSYTRVRSRVWARNIIN